MELARIALACLAVSLALRAPPAQAAPETYRLDSTHTTPMFEVLHLGVSLQRGFFTNASGTVTVDVPARTGSIDVVVGTGSVMTASRLLNDVLKGPDFLNAEQIPGDDPIAPRDVEFDGDKPVRANGELTSAGRDQESAAGDRQLHLPRPPALPGGRSAGPRSPRRFGARTSA